MINRNKKTHSYDNAINDAHNKVLTKFKKDYKIKRYVSPHMKEVKGLILNINDNINDNCNEKGKNIPEKNINNEKKDIFTKKNKIKNTNNWQIDKSLKSLEKKEIKLYMDNNNDKISENEKKVEYKETKQINLYTIQNKEKEKIIKNIFDIKKENTNLNKKNEDNKRDFFEYNKETKNNYSLMGFRNSNKNKYSKEKIKRIYNSKRYNKNLGNYNSNIEKEVKINPTKIEDKSYLNIFFSNKKKENEKLNKEEESYNNCRKINNKYEKIKETKKVDITGYNYKIFHRPKHLELKKEIFSEINNINNKIIKSDNDENVTDRKIEINTTIESKYKPKNNNINHYKNSYKSRYHSTDIYKSKNNQIETKFTNTNNNNNDNNIDSERYNSFENSRNKNHNISYIKHSENNDSTYNNDINKSTKYSSYYTEDNVYNNIVYEEKIRKIPSYFRNTIKINNLMDYKYNYYINKKNRKLNKSQIGYKPTNLGEIDKLFKDLIKIKNSKKKRFHREINKGPNKDESLL